MTLFKARMPLYYSVFIILGYFVYGNVYMNYWRVEKIKSVIENELYLKLMIYSIIAFFVLLTILLVFSILMKSCYEIAFYIIGIILEQVMISFGSISISIILSPILLVIAGVLFSISDGKHDGNFCNLPEKIKRGDNND